MLGIIIGGTCIHYCFLLKKINYNSYFVAKHPQIQGINIEDDIDWIRGASMDYSPLNEENDDAL